MGCAMTLYFLLSSAVLLPLLWQAKAKAASSCHTATWGAWSADKLFQMTAAGTAGNGETMYICRAIVESPWDDTPGDMYAPGVTIPSWDYCAYNLCCGYAGKSKAFEMLYSDVPLRWQRYPENGNQFRTGEYNVLSKVDDWFLSTCRIAAGPSTIVGLQYWDYQPNHCFGVAVSAYGASTDKEIDMQAASGEWVGEYLVAPDCAPKGKRAIVEM